MAQYKITAPDGNSYQITAPDSASQDQVLAYAKSNYQSAANEPAGLMDSAKGLLNQYEKSQVGSPSSLLQSVPKVASQAFGKAGQFAAEQLAKPEIRVNALTKKPYYVSTGMNPQVAAAIGTAGAMVPDVMQAATAPIEKPQTLEESAQNQGMKALGVTKRFLNTAPKADKMRESTQILMDEGVLKPFATTEDLVHATTKVQKESGQQIGNYLKSMSAQGKFLDKNAAIQELESLRPVGDNNEILKTGWYEDVNDRITKAVDTLKAHKGNGLSFETANQVKTTLQSVVDFTKKAQSPVDLADRVIAGKFRDFIDRSLEGVSKTGTEIQDPTAAQSFQQFMKAKKVYGAASTMIDPLYNRLSSEMGNKAVSITDWILAAGQVGAGNPLSAAASVGIKRGLERFGPQTGAVLLNKAAKAGVSAPPRFGGIGVMSRANLFQKAIENLKKLKGNRQPQEQQP